MSDASENEELALIEDLLVEMGHVLNRTEPLGNQTVEQLKLDSLSTLELLMLIEDRTGVEVPADPVTSGTTLLELATLIRQLKSA